MIFSPQRILGQTKGFRWWLLQSQIGFSTADLYKDNGSQVWWLDGSLHAKPWLIECLCWHCQEWFRQVTGVALKQITHLADLLVFAMRWLCQRMMSGNLVGQGDQRSFATHKEGYFYSNLIFKNVVKIASTVLLQFCGSRNIKTVEAK